MKSLSVILALALAAPAARAEPPKKPAVGNEIAAADVQRWIRFFDKLVEAVASNADDCNKMAIDVSAVIDSNRSQIEMAKDARAKGKKLPQEAQEHMLAGVRRMGPGIENCAENDSVKAAFAKLDSSHASGSTATTR